MASNSSVTPGATSTASASSPQRADVGLLIFPPFWRRGYAKIALTLLTAHAAAWHLRRLEFWTHNPVAARLVEGLGWACEGCLRDHAVLHGQLVDCWLFAWMREAP